MPVFQYHLAMIYKGKKQIPEAQTALKKAINSPKDFKEKSLAQAELKELSSQKFEIESFQMENISAIPLPTGEGAAKRRVRGTTRKMFFCGTPHPAFGHPLPLGEGCFFKHPFSNLPPPNVHYPQSSHSPPPTSA